MKGPNTETKTDDGDNLVKEVVCYRNFDFFYVIIVLFHILLFSSIGR